MALSSDASIFSSMAAVELVSCMKTASRSAGRGRSELSTNSTPTKKLILDSGRRLCLGMIRVRAGLGAGLWRVAGPWGPSSMSVAVSASSRSGIVGAAASGAVMQRFQCLSFLFLWKSTPVSNIISAFTCKYFLAAIMIVCPLSRSNLTDY